MTSVTRPSAPSAGRSRLRRFVELVFFTAAISLLVYLLDRIGFRQIGRALVGLGPAGASVILALGFCENFFDATALRASVDYRLGLFRTLGANSAGALVNVLAPWELGEVVKGALLGSELSTRDRISGVVVWNYAFKLTRPIVSFSAACVGVLLSHRFDERLEWTIIGANVLAFAPYLLLRLVLLAGPAGSMMALLHRFRMLRSRSEEMLVSARALDAQVKSFAHERPSVYAAVLTSQIAARCASWAALFASIRALGLDYGFGDIALIYAGLNVAEFVLTAFPARLGVAEGAAYALFALYGLDAEAGLIVYIVIRLKNLVTNGVVAPFAFRSRPPLLRA